MDLKFYYIFLICITFCNQIRLLNKQKKIINVVFAVTNKPIFIDFLLTAITSLLVNSNNNTIYNIYIQTDNLFKKENMKLISNLEKIYFNCFIHFINMNNDFKTALRGKLDISTYYRLKLPLLYPKINRMIHIDADAIVLKDLMELYTLNFEGKYILGRLDKLTNELDRLGIMTKTYINCGILLIDLYNLRKYKYVDKFMDYLHYHNNPRYLNHHDQTLINYVCHDKIGLLSPKFHMWPFSGIDSIKEFNNNLRTKYNEKEFIQAFNDPFIVHFPGSAKKNMSLDTRFYIKFNEYLNKSKEIKNLM